MIFTVNPFLSFYVDGIFSVFFFPHLSQTLDPGSYNSLPHAVVVNLAAFFELWDVFTLHWVTSTQVALSDDDMHDVSRLFIVYLQKQCAIRAQNAFYFQELWC